MVEPVDARAQFAIFIGQTDELFQRRDGTMDSRSVPFETWVNGNEQPRGLGAIAKALSMESAAIDFVRDAFGHLKAIAADKGGQVLLKIANVKHDAGVVDANEKDAFIAAARTRQWDRERSVRTLA